MSSATRIAMLERELSECVQSHQRKNGEMAAIEGAIERVTCGDWDDIVPAIERIGKELAAQQTLCRELALMLQSIDHPCPCGCGRRTLKQDQWRTIVDLLMAHPELTK